MTVRCFNSGQFGHWAKECKQKPRERERERGSCLCDEIGHVLKECLKNVI